MPEQMALGYLTNQYGRASDTFVRQEVRQLRKLGHTVRTFSIRRPEAEHAVGEEVREEQAGTEYVLEAGPLRLALALASLGARRPSRMARALACAWRTAAPGARGFVWQLFYLAEAAYLARRIEALGIEHVHNHIGMNSANVCMLAAILADVTWSMTVHGPHDFVEPFRWALPEKMRAAAFTVFVAEFGRSQGMWLTPPSEWPKLHVVRCGLDATFLGRAPAAVPARPRLLFVGRLSPEKGVLLLVEAAAQLHREGIRLELALIGDGPSRRDVEAAVARHRLDGSVALLGWCDTERVRSELLASRALVLPSFAEGLPIVLLEALALQRPVVSAHVAGIPELVEPERSGFLIAPGSVDELAAAMRRVIRAPADELAAMGRRGAARVAERHDSETNVRQLETLLWEVVSRRRRAASSDAR
jgi:glycosyltransferase involved in cell wall biosynthesis